MHQDSGLTAFPGWAGGLIFSVARGAIEKFLIGLQLEGFPTGGAEFFAKGGRRRIIPLLDPNGPRLSYMNGSSRFNLGSLGQAGLGKGHKASGCLESIWKILASDALLAVLAFWKA